jgi:chorismate dehydratase
VATPRLRVGIVDYLNAWPLAWGFLTGALDGDCEAVYLPPAGVADELGAGTLDVGLIPSIEVQRLPDLAVVPGLCVAATHEVQSVILVSRLPMERIRTVAIDRNSRTSAVLVQILLHDRHGIAPQVEIADPDAEAMLSRADAALIIGDPALRVDRGRFRVWDLAAEWRALTDRPFVFAVWAVRRRMGERAREVARLLSGSLALGIAEIDAVVERAQRELGLGASEARRYLRDNLSYRLDEEALEGLLEFYRRAAARGLIEPPTAIEFLAPSSRIGVSRSS